MRGCRIEPQAFEAPSKSVRRRSRSRTTIRSGSNRFLTRMRIGSRLARMLMHLASSAILNISSRLDEIHETFVTGNVLMRLAALPPGFAEAGTLPPAMRPSGRFGGPIGRAVALQLRIGCERCLRRATPVQGRDGALYKHRRSKGCWIAGRGKDNSLSHLRRSRLIRRERLVTVS